jgi:hypothetical protein
MMQLCATRRFSRDQANAFRRKLAWHLQQRAMPEKRFGDKNACQDGVYCKDALSRRIVLQRQLAMFKVSDHY